MTNNTNNKSDQNETLAQLFEVPLYKKDIIAIQEKFGINDNENHATMHQSKTEREPEGKTLADSYELLSYLMAIPF
jgi:hypothetical protein